MTRVPRDVSGDEPARAREFVELVEVDGVGTPVPAGIGVIYEVDGESELVSAMPWPRFCGPLGQEVFLPHSAAVTLEGLEASLRSLGLVGANEVMCQLEEGSLHFRVKVTDGELASAIVDGVHKHFLITHDAGYLDTQHDPAPEATHTRKGLSASPVFDGKGAEVGTLTRSQSRSPLRASVLPATYNEWTTPDASAQGLSAGPSQEHDAPAPSIRLDQ